ncbi:MAG: bacteriocin [Ruminococcus sp.]|nr:bacteriocin [Ruminococcus sp.]
MTKGEELHLPAVFLFCQSGDLPKRQMSLFDFLDDDKEEVEAVNEKLQELTEEELEQVNGGIDVTIRICPGAIKTIK